MELGHRLGPLLTVFRDVAKFPSPLPGAAMDEHSTQVEDLRAALERVAEKHAEPFWVKGPPDYERTAYGTVIPQGERDRYVWVVTTDREGRTDGSSIGRIHGKFTDAFKAEQAAWVEWMESSLKNGERQGPAPKVTIVPWLNVMHVDQPLEQWWNIRAWAECPRPRAPEPGEGADPSALKVTP